jgi:hypothetical protein
LRARRLESGAGSFAVIPSSTFREAAKRRLDASIHIARATLAAHPERLGAYDALVRVVQRHGVLLARRCPGCGPDVNVGLVELAAQALDWMRPVEAWRPSHPSPWVQFASLAEHLLARFPMPRFMASVWLAKREDSRLPQQDWYKRVGRGESMRRMDLPIRLTRTMAHRFLSAPSHFTAIEALRWAQVLGLGGSPALATAVLSTRLGRELEDETFWETVIRFFVNAPELDLAHVGPIVDYLQHRRSPRSPEFSMKGRTPASMLRLVGEWHRELARAPVGRVAWSRSRLRELTWTERVVVRKEDEMRVEQRAWSIRELCSDKELRAEGRAMGHCVAMYASRCAAGRSSIWSMRFETPHEVRRILTIEVDMSRRRVVQARRRFNALPTEDERALVGRWASREFLSMAELRRM